MATVVRTAITSAIHDKAAGTLPFPPPGPETAYAHATAQILLQAWGRIYGVRLPSSGTLVALIYRKYGRDGGYAHNVIEYFGNPSARRAEGAAFMTLLRVGERDITEDLRDYFILPTLTCTRVDSANALLGTQRDVLCAVTLNYSQWIGFKDFFANHPRAVLEPNHLSLPSSADVTVSLAFVVDTAQSSVGKVCIRNSWSDDGDENGRFYVQSLHGAGFADPQLYNVTWLESAFHPDLLARRQLPLPARTPRVAGNLASADLSGDGEPGMREGALKVAPTTRRRRTASTAEKDDLGSTMKAESATVHAHMLPRSSCTLLAWVLWLLVPCFASGMASQLGNRTVNS